MKRILFVLSLLFLVSAASARVERYWEPETSDVEWNTPENWTGDLVPQMNRPSADSVERAYIYGSEFGGPVMGQDVTYLPVDAVKLGYNAVNTIEATWTINAGSFGNGSSPEYVSIGDGGGYGTSHLYINGGHMVIYDHFEIGRKSSGHLLMTGGLVECGSWRIGDSGEGADGYVELFGGTVQATELLIRTDNVTAYLDIEGEGRVELSGNYVDSVNAQIAANLIWSQGTVNVDFDGTTTVLTVSYDPAINPVPSAGSVEVDIDSQLEWSIGFDPNSNEYIGYKVYMGTKSDNMSLIASVPVETPYYAPANLLYNTEYFWRVDAYTASKDIINNSVWYFTSESSLPLITAQPQDIEFAIAKQTASFTVEAERGPLSYQWYHYSVDPNFTAPIIIEENDTKYSGYNTETLTINNLTSADTGVEYFCEVSNSEGSVDSDTASIYSIYNGLMSHWTMDNAADPNDLVGPNETELVGTIGFVTGLAELGKALHTGGEAGLRIYSGDYYTPTRSAMTVSCWVKCLARTAEDNAFVCKYGLNDAGWQLKRSGSSYKASFTLTGTTGADDLAGSTDVMDYNWHHVVGTYNGTTRCLYVDGQLDASQADTGVINDTEAPLGLSRNFDPDGQPYGSRGLEGYLDDVRIYDYALSAEDIAVLYTNVMDDLCVNQPEFDLNGDCLVNLLDLQKIAADWMDCGLFPSCVDFQ